MFNHVQSDLRELLELVRKTATWDATLAANPTIKPTDAAYAERHRQEQHIAELKRKYDL